MGILENKLWLVEWSYSFIEDQAVGPLLGNLHLIVTWFSQQPDKVSIVILPHCTEEAAEA